HYWQLSGLRTLDLHDALPIGAWGVVPPEGKRGSCRGARGRRGPGGGGLRGQGGGRQPGRGDGQDAASSSHAADGKRAPHTVPGRSEEHTSELQSREKLVCRLL